MNNRIEIERSTLSNLNVKRRDMRLDALRGLFLIVMAGVHVPTPVSSFLQDPLGFNGAAEGFIFLSACLAGIVYGRTYLQADWRAMSRRMWKRARQIYAVHLAVLLPIALIILAVANQLPPLALHFNNFLAQPLGSLALMPLLLHQPPLFDILPLYIIFLAVSPWLMAMARRRGWGIVLLVSALGWLAAQFRLDARLIGDPARLLPLQWGSFDILAWQFLWICGLALGETSLQRPPIKKEFRLWLGIPAAVLALGALSFRRGLVPLSWVNPDIFLWADKWTLGPLRLLDFAAWTILLLAWNPQLPKALLAPTALLGRNSLSVFAFHLPLVIAASDIVLQFTPSTAWQISIALLVIALLFPWAALWELFKHRGAGTAIAPNLPAAKPQAQAMQVVLKEN